MARTARPVNASTTAVLNYLLLILPPPLRTYLSNWPEPTKPHYLQYKSTHHCPHCQHSERHGGSHFALSLAWCAWSLLKYDFTLNFTVNAWCDYLNTVSCQVRQTSSSALQGVTAVSGWVLVETQRGTKMKVLLRLRDRFCMNYLKPWHRYTSVFGVVVWYVRKKYDTQD